MCSHLSPPRKRAGSLALLLYFLSMSLAPAPSNATLNIEKMRNPKKQDGIGGNLDLSLEEGAGNVDYFRIGVGAGIQYETLQSVESIQPMKTTEKLIFLTGRYDRAHSNGQVFRNRGFAHLRGTWMLRPNLGPEAFTQIQFDSFWRLKRRLLIGVGGRFALALFPSFQAFVGSGYMIENELLSHQDSSYRIDHRWNNYLNANVILSPILTLGNTIYFQPLFTRLNDFRIYEETLLTVQVLQYLSFSSGASYAYDSRPPSGVRRNDFRFTQQISLMF